MPESLNQHGLNRGQKLVCYKSNLSLLGTGTLLMNYNTLDTDNIRSGLGTRSLSTIRALEDTPLIVVERPTSEEDLDP